MLSKLQNWLGIVQLSHRQALQQRKLRNLAVWMNELEDRLVRLETPPAETPVDEDTEAMIKGYGR